jgi:hypothetical protein
MIYCLTVCKVRQELPPRRLAPSEILIYSFHHQSERGCPLYDLGRSIWRRKVTTTRHLHALYGKAPVDLLLASFVSLAGVLDTSHGKPHGGKPLRETSHRLTYMAQISKSGVPWHSTGRQMTMRRRHRFGIREKIAAQNGVINCQIRRQFSLNLQIGCNIHDGFQKRARPWINTFSGISSKMVLGFSKGTSTSKGRNRGKVDFNAGPVFGNSSRKPFSSGSMGATVLDCGNSSKKPSWHL